MSRVGKYPVTIKNNVEVSLDNSQISLKGTKGTAALNISSYVKVEKVDNAIVVTPIDNTLFAKKMWGTMRAHINNMMTGVSEGFKMNLEIQGVGYRASIKGSNLVLQLGFSHDVIVPIPDDVKISCPDLTHINIEGISKQRVGQVAAKIRAFKKPEPYKGKGIRYVNEVVLRKEGKKK